MIRLTAFFLLLIASPLRAQESSQPSTPSPAAIALSQALRTPTSPDELASTSPDELDRVRRLVEITLRDGWGEKHGPPCDPEILRCRATAERIAREVASEVLAERQRRSEAWRAALIDAYMSPEEIAAALRFAPFPAVRALVLALTWPLNGEPPTEGGKRQLEQAIVLRQLPGEQMPGLSPAVMERYYSATAMLPRIKPLVDCLVGCSPPASKP